jgi:hypothetical protein
MMESYSSQRTCQESMAACVISTRKGEVAILLLDMRQAQSWVLRRSSAHSAVREPLAMVSIGPEH